MDLKALKLLLLLVGNEFRLRIPVGKLLHRKEMRTAIYGWRLQSKRIDHGSPKPFCVPAKV